MNNVNVKHVKVIVTLPSFFARKEYEYNEERSSYLKQQRNLNKVKFDMSIEYGQKFWTIKYLIFEVCYK